jgi:hypothetical protein
VAVCIMRWGASSCFRLGLRIWRRMWLRMWRRWQRTSFGGATCSSSYSGVDLACVRSGCVCTGFSSRGAAEVCEEDAANSTDPSVTAPTTATSAPIEAISTCCRFEWGQDLSDSQQRPGTDGANRSSRIDVAACRAPAVPVAVAAESDAKSWWRFTPAHNVTGRVCVVESDPAAMPMWTLKSVSPVGQTRFVSTFRNGNSRVVAFERRKDAECAIPMVCKRSGDYARSQLMASETNQARLSADVHGSDVAIDFCEVTSSEIEVVRSVIVRRPSTKLAASEWDAVRLRLQQEFDMDTSEIT